MIRLYKNDMSKYFKLEECHESSEGASVNVNRILRNWGAIWTDGRRPEVRIALPISQNSVGIYRCALARLMAFLHF